MLQLGFEGCLEGLCVVVVSFVKLATMLLTRDAENNLLGRLMPIMY